MFNDYIFNPMDNFGCELPFEPKKCFKTSSKSSSSTSSEVNNIQETSQASVDGVVGGDIAQGETINITNEFPDAVSDTFSDLIKLAGQSVSLVGDAGAVALDAVSERRTIQEVPQVATLNKLSPIIMVGLGLSAIVAIYAIFKGIKK